MAMGVPLYRWMLYFNEISHVSMDDDWGGNPYDFVNPHGSFHSHPVLAASCRAARTRSMRQRTVGVLASDVFEAEPRTPEKAMGFDTSTR